MISEVGFDETYGARPIKRAIQDKIEDFISEEVLKGEILTTNQYLIYSEENTVKIKTTKKSRKKKGINYPLFYPNKVCCPFRLGINVCFVLPNFSIIFLPVSIPL